MASEGAAAFLPFPSRRSPFKRGLRPPARPHPTPVGTGTGAGTRRAASPPSPPPESLGRLDCCQPRRRADFQGDSQPQSWRERASRDSRACKEGGGWGRLPLVGLPAGGAERCFLRPGRKLTREPEEPVPAAAASPSPDRFLAIARPPAEGDKHSCLPATSAGPASAGGFLRRRERFGQGSRTERLPQRPGPCGFLANKCYTRSSWEEKSPLPPPPFCNPEKGGTERKRRPDVHWNSDGRDVPSPDLPRDSLLIIRICKRYIFLV